MRSGTVLDRNRPVLEAADDLLVLWQHPETREIIPIGRFGHRERTYSFAYTRAALDIKDFRPLPGLDDLRQRYASNTIPAVFAQRVMDSDRPDYSKYLHTLGLDPAQATPWEQIVQSGGQRTGDTLQFMPVPTVADGRARSRFLVNGVRHISEVPRTVGQRTFEVTPVEQEAAIQSLTDGASVSIEPETNNRVDPDAVVATVHGVPVGWVPRALSASVRELLASGSLPATVFRVSAPGTPPHIRLVLDLDVPAPPGFSFDRAGRWDPLPAQ